MQNPETVVNLRMVAKYIDEWLVYRFFQKLNEAFYIFSDNHREPTFAIKGVVTNIIGV